MSEEAILIQRLRESETTDEKLVAVLVALHAECDGYTGPLNA